MCVRACAGKGGGGGGGQLKGREPRCNEKAAVNIVKVGLTRMNSPTGADQASKLGERSIGIET